MDFRLTPADRLRMSICKDCQSPLGPMDENGMAHCTNCGRRQPGPRPLTHLDDPLPHTDPLPKPKHWWGR
jgi:hypothetical protein